MTSVILDIWRERVAAMLLSGADLRTIETTIETSGLDSERRAALWLWAWSRATATRS